MSQKTSGANLKVEVQGLLDAYVRALTSGDGRGAAVAWDVPALVISDQGVIAVDSLKQVEEFFGGAREQYAAKGVVSTRAEIQRLEAPSEKIAVVTVSFPYLDASGGSKGSESSSYTLRRGDDGRLKIRVALMHGGVASAG